MNYGDVSETEDTPRGFGRTKAPTQLLVRGIL